MASPDAAAGSGRILSLRDVSLRQDGEFILKDINLELLSGEIHALVGGSDAAKSGICSLAAGELACDRGEVATWDGPLEPAKRKAIMAKGIIKVPKTAQLFPHLSVAQNLVTGFVESWWANWGSWRSRYAGLREWLDRYAIDLPDRQQLAYIPRESWLFIQMLNLLYRGPRLFIIDETMELLLPEQRAQLWPILLEQVREGMAVLWATQSLDDAMTYSNRLSMLYGQRLLYTADTDQLDRLSLVRVCYGRQMREGDATLEQFHQMLCFTEASLRDLPTAVVVVDNDLRIRFANRSAGELFGVGEEEMLNTPLEDLNATHYAQLADIVQRAIWEAEKTGGDVVWRSQPYASESENRQADVRVRHISEGDEVIGFLVVIEDVSLREELHKQLVLSENMASIGLLAAGVAHEVNNPLAIIANYNRFLRGKVEGEGPREAVQQIEAQAKRIQQIVHSLTAISSGRAESGRPVDLHRLAKDLILLLEADARGQDLVFDCKGPAEPLMVTADPNEMRLVVINLLRNSMEALSGKKGEIKVEVSAANSNGDAPQVRLTVRDNGPGIGLADPNHVFLPFVSGKKNNGLNQGIGLSIVHQIVGKYQGSISVENLVGGGCQFTILLPCRVREEP